MRLIVLSDIHGNLEALRAVLADAASAMAGSAPSCTVCLGDMVGYGANPEEVLQIVRQAGMASVLGNHEMGVVRPETRSRFNPQAWEAVQWTASRLSQESLAFLQGLPKAMVLHGCRFVHGLPPSEVDTYLFLAAPERVAKAMRRIPEEVCFVGHTHRLALLTLDDQNGLKEYPLDQGDAVLKPGRRTLINAGSVGQPRDGDPRAKYCLYDTDARRLTIRYVPYDNQAAAEKILRAGQPRIFAERLIGQGRP